MMAYYCQGTLDELIRNACGKMAIYIYNGENVYKLFSQLEYYKDENKLIVYADNEEDILDILKIAIKITYM